MTLISGEGPLVRGTGPVRTGITAILPKGRGFRERSTLGSCSAWHHDRTLHALAEGGTRVLDEVRFTPRLGAAGGLQALVFEAAFRWRHRRLRAVWGAA